MISAWNDKEAKKFGKNLLQLRVYTSRLLGKEEDLVLHGGGNTSVKITERNIFGEKEEILYSYKNGEDQTRSDSNTSCKETWNTTFAIPTTRIWKQ